jgi:hypothetical protein
VKYFCFFISYDDYVFYLFLQKQKISICVCLCVCVCTYCILKYTCNHVSVGEEAAPDVKYKAQERGVDANDILQYMEYTLCHIHKYIVY